MYLCKWKRNRAWAQSPKRGGTVFMGERDQEVKGVVQGMEHVQDALLGKSIPSWIAFATAAVLLFTFIF